MRPFEPNPHSSEYLYVQVAEHVVARIAEGDLQPGAMLPNEDDFAEQYQVSRDTARRAVAELRRRGVVKTVPSKGTFVL